MRLPVLFLSSAVVTAGFATPALAYLDPGTGSMLLQLILGGVAGAMVVGKLYWAQFKSLFTRRPSSDLEPESEADKDPAQE